MGLFALPALPVCAPVRALLPAATSCRTVPHTAPLVLSLVQAYVGLTSSEDRHMTHTYGESVLDFGTGDRVELHPGTDTWMRGERFGTVLPASQYRAVTLVRVKLDSGRTIRVSPENLRHHLVPLTGDLFA